MQEKNKTLIIGYAFTTGKKKIEKGGKKYIFVILIWEF